MKALVLWADNTSTNLGVRALGSGSAALLERVWPGVEVSFQNYGPGDAPVRIGDGRRNARRLLARRDELVDWLRTFDLVVDTRSGDSFTDHYGIRRLMDMSSMALLVRRARVPLVFGPQTIGPFSSRRGALVGRACLRDARTVMARDSISDAAGAALGRRPDALTTDVVFAIEAQPADRERDVVFNVSGLLWQPNPHVDHLRYRETVLDICRELTDRGRAVSLLAHVIDSPDPDNDVPAVREVARLLSAGNGAAVDIVVPDSLEQVRACVNGANVVIGSRMHACLNALSQQTPAIPLAYSRKFAPLLDDLGWQHTIDLRSAADAGAEVLRAVDDDSLAVEVRHLHERTEGLLTRAEDVLRATL